MPPSTSYLKRIAANAVQKVTEAIVDKKDSSSKSTGKTARRRRNRQKKKSSGSNSGSGSTMSMSFAPTSIANTVAISRPTVRHRNDGSIVVSGTELVLSNVGALVANGFAIANFIWLNPGLPASFPWLSPIATQYQMYKFDYLEYIYIPSVSTSTAGDVILSPNYNATMPIPSSEQIAMNMDGAVEASVWTKEHIILDPKKMCQDSNDDFYKYVRAVSLSGDIKTYDAGTLTVATASITNNGSNAGGYGKLFVRYSVCLKGMQTQLGIYSLRPPNSSIFNFVGNQAVGTGVSNLIVQGTPLFDGLNLAPVNNFWANNTFSNFILPAGIYRVHARLQVTISWGSAQTVQTSYINTLLKGGVLLSTLGNTDVNLLTAAGPNTVIFPLVGWVAVSSADVIAGSNYINLTQIYNVISSSGGVITAYNFNAGDFQISLA